MGRRSADITLTVGRDTGKVFRITEMSADRAERWGIRAMMEIAGAGARLPDGALDAGIAGIAATLPGMMVQGLRSLAGLTYTPSVEALLDEMMGCIQFVAPGSAAVVPLAAGDACQIEDVRTRLHLRYEVLKLHMDPTLAGALSI